MGKEQAGKIAFLAGIEKARFRKPVRPGDRLVTKAELTRIRGFTGKAKVTGYVDDEVVAEGEFLFMVGSTLGKEGSGGAAEKREGEGEKCA